MKVRKLPVPSEYKIHVDHEEAKDHSMKWVMQMSFFEKEPKKFDVLFHKHQATWLCSSLCPLVKNKEDLFLITDLGCWFFYYDDEYVSPPDTESGLSLDQTLENLQTINQKLKRIVQGESMAADEKDPAVLGLYDVCRRLYARGYEGFWLQKFRTHLIGYLELNSWNVQSTYNKSVSSIDDYLNNRILDIGSLLFLDLSAHFNYFSTENPFFSSELYQKIEKSVAINSIIANDLMGIEREIKKGDPLNIVFTYQKEFGLSLQEAFERVVEFANLEMERFQQLKRETESDDLQLDDSIKTYFRCCDNHLSGHIEWYRVTGRYS